MKHDALIVIDMQTALVEAEPYYRDGVVKNIKSLISACRAANIPVIYIQHDDSQDEQSMLTPGSAGWTIYQEIAPESSDKVFEKRFNSAFRQTRLKEHLDNMGAKNLILCGMQTEYCVDTTCKVAFELGYSITIPRSSTTTFDNDFARGRDLVSFYENYIWQYNFARIVDINSLILEIDS